MKSQGVIQLAPALPVNSLLQNSFTRFGYTMIKNMIILGFFPFLFQPFFVYQVKAPAAKRSIAVPGSNRHEDLKRSEPPKAPKGDATVGLRAAPTGVFRKMTARNVNTQ